MLSKFLVECNKCKQAVTLWVEEIPGYFKTYLRSYFCQSSECKAAQVIRYKFEEGKPQLVNRLEPSDVHVEKPPETGISIRPRAKSR
jgi:hypothetical protein